MDKIIFTQGRAFNVAVPAGSQIAIFSQGPFKVYQLNSFVNQPQSLALLSAIDGISTFSYLSALSAAATIVIDANAAPVYYQVGVNPVVFAASNGQVQPTPGVLNATGALTAAMILSGIVTSTTAAAVAGTVPTGTVLDAAAQFAVNDSIDFSVIATGANAFTVTAAAGVTIVGSAVVATATSGRFRLVKTAAATYIIYRLS